MSVLLEPPAAVLVAGPSGAPSDSVRSALLDGAASEVRTASDAASAGEAAAEDEVACLVVAGAPSAPEAASVCDAVRDADDDLPVVFHAESDGEGPIADLLAGLGATVVPQSAPNERLREAVDGALATYRRRRIRAEESEMLRAMLDQLGKSIYFKDEDGRIVHHADVGGGPDPEDARGKTDPEIYDEEWAIESYERELEVIEEERTLVDYDHYDPEADLWTRTTKVPWRDDGEVRGLIGITTDVTEYKRRERELDELQRRFDSFVHQLRHDLKTRLQIAVGNLAAREADDDRLAAVRRSLADIDRIVEDYGRLANRSIDVDRGGSPTELRDAARTAWSTAASGDAALELDGVDDAYVNAPRAMVLVVLENLFREAADGDVEAPTVRVGTTDDGFYVEDTGSRVSDPKLAMLAQDGYATAEDGSGHELSLVKEEIDRHLWTLSVGESPEGGARFEVRNCLIDAVGLGDGRSVDLDSARAVGDLEAGGEADYDDEADRWRVCADGSDLFRQDNDCYFVSATVEGDVSVRAKVARLEPVADLSKAGLMIRQSLAEQAPYGYVGATPARGTELLWRSEPGADGRSRHLEEEAVPFDWYRLDRSGDEIAMSVSLDGERWQRVDRRAVATDGPVHVGLAVCSTVVGERCEALFENVEIREAGGE
ncbi:PAS domain-containing protein [Halomicrobium salinisoli]|uniref:PAS domain-containing protein n=1 Tax=Halomicrobium salinisoli TaxID=2878391 RepID=UPI001CF06357|nr:PAS domain-containing protein [Halomicrobium salinisoli]